MSTLVRFHLPLPLSRSFSSSTPHATRACFWRMPWPHASTGPHLCVSSRSTFNKCTMEVSDAAVLAGISAAFIVLKKVRRKREKYGRSIWVKNYMKSRNSRLIRDLEFNEDILFKNFTRMSKRNF
jgi:hypothetical protein